ncbi:response regulator [Flexithrix dorotheae]|uniref:response regulator n=1 Tax=Flexithrix dorotheae TaxID=70993 RepID=UPI00037FFE67|nr:response regulator [Flexithrix dorotheae]
MDNNNYLIIEDQDIETMVTSRLIKKWFPDLVPTEKRNGKEALEYLSNAKNNFPGLIMVDLIMPIMDGFEFLEKYDKTFLSKHPNTIVVVFTTSINPRDKTKALSFKCVNGFLEKPIGKEELAKVLK